MAIDEQWDEPGLTGTVANGAFEVVRRLSSTPRSDVYEVEHVKRGQRVALKVLRAHPIADALREHVREQRTLVRFDHAGIVDASEIGLHDGAPYVASELVRGEPLAALLKRGAIAPDRALAIARQMLEALSVAHDRGACHRWLDPEHVMIARGEGDTDLVKVLGLGLAQLVPDGAKLGDANYMPPEHARGTGGGPQADLYAVGAMLFEMLTGHPPFHAKGASALMRLHTYASVQTLKQRAPDRTFTPETEAVVARAMIKSKDARFASAREMIAALDIAARSVAAADAAAIVPPASEPRPSSDESLAALARDFRAANAKPEIPPAFIPTNAGREVRALSWSARITNRLRKLAAPIRRLDRRVQLALAGAAVLLVIVLVIALRPRNDAHAPSGSVHHVTADELALRSANELLDHHLPKHAMTVLAAKVGAGTWADAMLTATLLRALDAGDAGASLLALDVLARLVPFPATIVAARASTATVTEVRHRAIAVAEAHAAGDRIDRVASWSLDLAAATACTEQRALITKLANTGDRRAIPALRTAQGSTCVAGDASAAIAKLERGAR